MFGVLEKCKKNKIFGYLSSGPKIRKIETENAQDAFSRQEPVVKGIVSGGVGPWGGPARDSKHKA